MFFIIPEALFELAIDIDGFIKDYEIAKFFD